MNKLTSIFFQAEEHPATIMNLIVDHATKTTVPLANQRGHGIEGQDAKHEHTQGHARPIQHPNRCK